MLGESKLDGYRTRRNLWSDLLCERAASRKVDGVAEALSSTLVSAHATGRLVTGVLDCAHMLQNCRNRIMLCVLATPKDNATVNIHSTLIDAYCWEYDVRLLKVDNTAKLDKLLGREEGEAAMSCFVVLCPSEVTEGEEALMAYHKETAHVAPTPVISLPKT